MLFSFYKEEINLEFLAASMLQLWRKFGIKCFHFFSGLNGTVFQYILGRNIMGFWKHEKLSWNTEMFMS